MNLRESSGLGRLNSLQIAALAVTTSTVAAVSVLFAVRLSMGWGKSSADGVDAVEDTRPAVESSTSIELTGHFTEDLILPGLTETGQDVLRDYEEIGRSPEGV